MTDPETASRTMVLERLIDAPVSILWAAWTDPASLTQWWGPDGFSCRTERIDLRAGGEWVFDMIGPDGTIYPNHHRYTAMVPQKRIDYTLHWGEDGPKHADASVTFEDLGGGCRVTLTMVFLTREEHDAAKGVGAYELGLQTLGKLARFAGAD
ncbi:MAG: SRPBCC domain-containing protein [Silicimonas sp.]|nr:SRPBCC domain-containing protein [Silicimonas sp.]